MYDHIGVKVKDLEASTRLDKAALAGLGHVLHPGDETYAGFGPKGEPGFWLHRNDKAKGGAHIAFRAEDHAAVDRFHKDGLRREERTIRRRRAPALITARPITPPF